ncbi:hypothetical protein RFI_03610, partial [Reticulomyxa filosa]
SPKQANKSEIKTEESKKDNEKEPECCDWPHVVSFLMSDNVQQLLPELVKRISVLRERKDRGEQVSLADVVPSVLTEKPFEAIVKHDFFKKYLFCYNTNIEYIDEEAVSAWVSDMLELVTLSFVDGKDNGLWKMHVDMWREEVWFKKKNLGLLRK